MARFAMPVPPLVYDAVWHVKHASDTKPSALVPGLYKLSAPQLLHVCTATPVALSRKSLTCDSPVMYVPGAHAVGVEPPSHEWPAGHAVQVSCLACVVSPLDEDVYDP